MRGCLQPPLLLTMAILLPFLPACERELTGSEAQSVVALADPMFDDLLAGLKTSDYEMFSRNFDTFMRRSIPESCFEDWREDLQSKLGRYVSREVRRAAQSDEYYVVDYLALFEDRDAVIVGAAFHIARPHAINHFWIETGQLRWAPEPGKTCQNP